MSDISELYHESYAVFRKYQMTVHNESASDCTNSDFDNFLVDTPLCHVLVCSICYNICGRRYGTVCVNMYDVYAQGTENGRPWLLC